MFTVVFICELLLQHVSASVLSCLQGVIFSMCASYVSNYLAVVVHV